MTRTVIALLLAFAMSGAGTAHAATTTGSKWADRQLATYKTPLPPFPLSVSRDYCPDGWACTDADGTIWMPERDRFVLAHEVGHNYLEQLSPGWQSAILNVLGYPAGHAWYVADGLDCLDGNLACPNEQAADAYAACALGQDPQRRVRRDKRRALVGGSWETAYGYRPTWRQHRRMCRVIRDSATL